MKRTAWVALLLIAGGNGTATLMTESGKTLHDAEVEQQVTLLETPFGGDPHQRDRDRAAAWLVAHPDRAYPLLAARVDAGLAGVAVIELLPRFARAESIPRLERLLAGPEATAWEAGQALALHPQAIAGEVLRRSLGNSDRAIAIIAADALGVRGHVDDCPALVRLLSAPDAGVRYHVVQASGKLGCLTREALDSLARTDLDSDIRELATRLLSHG